MDHILNDINIDINKNDIINTIYTAYILNNYKNIDRLLFIDTINEKIYDYISQVGKILLTDWEQYNSIPLILLCLDEL